MEIGARIIVEGMVQGVGFRYFVYQQASRLGLKGYTRNLYNGDVEIECEGERALVEVLIQKVRVGPRSAQVNDVKVEWKDGVRGFQGFEIRH